MLISPILVISLDCKVSVHFCQYYTHIYIYIYIYIYINTIYYIHIINLFIYIIYIYIIYIYIHKLKLKSVHNTQSAQKSKIKEHNRYIVKPCHHKAIVLMGKMYALDCLHDFTLYIYNAPCIVFFEQSVFFCNLSI